MADDKEKKDPSQDQQGPKPQKAEDAPLAVKSEVMKWQKKIRKAKQDREKDFARMRRDMEFVYGIQWPDQEDLSDERYRVNIVLREINQAVSSMYARNPKAIARRRERLVYSMWDGKQESLQLAAMTMMQNPGNPIAMAVIQDEMKGREDEAMVDGLCKTLEIEYQVQVDQQEPNFKLQMKQLVRRTKVCGVGFVRPCFVRDDIKSLNTTATESPLKDRMAKLKLLVDGYEKGSFDDSDARLEDMKMLINSIQYTMSRKSDVEAQNERIVFDFPPATSVIVDPRCRMLKGFVGAHWVVQEYILPLDEVKAFSGRDDIKVGAGDGYAKQYSASGDDKITIPDADGSVGKDHVCVCVWEVFDKGTKTRFFLCDGYGDYLLEPQEPQPCVQRFWPLIPLTFNDTETEPGLKASIYPPSDVTNLRSAQQDINRCRDGLRRHRRTNKPKYFTAPGALSDEDKDQLKDDLAYGAVVELQNLPPGEDPNKVIAPFKPVPIDAAAYDTKLQENDVLYATNSQRANLGPLTPSGTATEATISEQSRLSVTSSDVDELDELLTEMASVSGEMLLRAKSKAGVVRDVGVGAVWPESPAARDELAGRVYLEIQAASTGRPNKGMEIANFERLAPLLLNAGANPVFIVEEGVKRLDDRLDVNAAFPVVPPSMLKAGAMVPPGPGPEKGARPRPTPNETPAGPPAPLPASTDAASGNPS